MLTFAYIKVCITRARSRNRVTYVEIPTAQVVSDQYPTVKTGNNEIKGNVTERIVSARQKRFTLQDFIRH